MRALWSNYEGADALPYGQWLAQLQHQATTRQADESNRLFAGQWSRALLFMRLCFWITSGDFPLTKQGS